MKRSEVEQFLISKGLSLDKYGNFVKETESGKYRYKMNATSVRYEKQLTLGNAHEWLRIRSAYYKDLSITPEGKLKGMRP